MGTGTRVGSTVSTGSGSVGMLVGSNVGTTSRLSSGKTTASSTLLPHVTSAVDVPQTMLRRPSTASRLVPQMMFSPAPQVPQTMFSSASSVPQTMFSQSPPPQSVPQTMFSAMSSSDVPHTMLRRPSTSTSEVPQTMLSRPSVRLVPQTMFSPAASVKFAPHTMFWPVTPPV